MSVLNPPLFKSISTTKKGKSVPFFKDRFLGGLMLANSATEPADVIPRVADANARLSLTAEGVVVSGAGVPEINTTWTQRGVYLEKPYYNRANDPTDLVHNVLKWEDVTGPNIWQFYGADGALYTSTEDVPTPDLVTVWTPERDIPGPPPTVTHSPGQVTGAGYQVIQDADSGAGAGLTYTFNGDGADADAGLWVTDCGDSSMNGAWQFDVDSSNYVSIGGFNPTSITGGPAWLTLDGHYAMIGTGTYPWEQPWDTLPPSGVPPPPTVLRNPIASEANWSHP